MRFFSFIFILKLLIFLATATIYAQGTLIFESIHCPALENNFLEDSPDRYIITYLPEGYDDNIEKFYPVVYLLHGFTHTQSTWLKWGLLNMDIKSVLDSLITQEVIQPMIVVMPNGYNKYQGSWYANSSVTGNWEDYIVVDLVKYIDDNYRTLTQKESRGIAGHSMGGTGSFKLAMKYPDVFNAVFSLSAAFISFEHSLMGPDYKQALINAANETDAAQFGSLDWRARVAIAAAAAFAPNTNRIPYYGDFPVDNNGGLIVENWERWLQHDAYTMINSFNNNLLLLKGIWIECGTNDDLYNSNLKTSQALDSLGITHVWEDYEGDHVNKIPERIEEKMLPFFSEVLADEITNVEVSNSSNHQRFELTQNYPNPFNPITNIEYQVRAYRDTPQHVELSIYNLLGQKVATLVSKTQTAGTYEVEWDANGFASGIYFYQLTAGDFKLLKKMVLLK